MNDQLKSKRNIFLTGLHLLLIIGAFGGLGTSVGLDIIKALDQGVPLIKTFFFILPLSFSFMVYMIYHVFTSTPTWTINRQGIERSTLFKNKKYSWDEVQSITLTGKKPQKFIGIPLPEEASTIQLMGDDEIHIWTKYYSNMSDLRIVLERVDAILQGDRQFAKLDFAVTRLRYEQNIDEHSATVFNGNHLFTFNGLVFYGIPLFSAYMLSRPRNYRIEDHKELMVFVFLSMLALMGIMSHQMHYFKITDQFLVVRNSIWFWVKDIYPLKDIREVVIERPLKKSTSLRIITQDFRDKLYPAGSLNKQSWEALIAQFSHDGIKVRKEVEV